LLPSDRTALIVDLSAPGRNPAGCAPRRRRYNAGVIRADSATVIERPPQAVFDYVATGFFRNYPRWAPEVVQLTALSPGPIRVGALGRQVRVDFGRRTEASFRVTRLEAATAVAFEGITTPFTIFYGFAAFGEHTRVTLVFELLRLEFFMRPFERIIRAAVRDSVAGTMARLKATAEREIERPGAVVASPVPATPDAASTAAAAVQHAAPVDAAPAAASGGPLAASPAIPPTATPDPGLSRA
jgi:hypothetical protein